MGMQHAQGITGSRYTDLSERPQGKSLDINRKFQWNSDIPYKFMGEIYKLDRLIEFVKYDVWADSLYFLFLLLFSISKILVSLQTKLPDNAQSSENSVIETTIN